MKIPEKVLSIIDNSDNPEYYKGIYIQVRQYIKEKMYSPQAFNKTIFKGWVEGKVRCNNFIERFERIRNIGKKVTKEKFYLIYGDKFGEQKWNSYLEKQRVSNTFEYKREKYGWDLEKFNSYNKSRAITKENLQKKYGKEIGLKKWNEYITKQKRNGKVLDYFIEKYGPEGEGIYEEVCKKKSHSLDMFIKRYGKENGIEKYKEYIEKRSNNYFYSQSATEFFEELINRISFFKGKIYYSKTKEFGILGNSGYFFYDFTIPDLKIIIEYNGNFWQADKNRFNEDDIVPIINKKAGEIWKRDEIKKKLAEKRGYDLIIIWEDEVNNNNRDKVLSNLTDIIRRKFNEVSKS